MAATTQEALEIQNQIAGRNPGFTAQATAVSAVNGAPASAGAGVSVAGASGRSTVDTALAVKSNAATGVQLLLWVYYSAIDLWAVVDNSARTIADGRGWTQIMRSGPVDRVYIEITAITGGTVDLYAGACDVS